MLFAHSRHGHVEAIKVLVAEGACSPNIENHWMSTPLHVAASNGRKQAVKLLLEHPDIHVVRVQLPRIYFPR